MVENIQIWPEEDRNVAYNAQIPIIGEIIDYFTKNGIYVNVHVATKEEDMHEKYDFSVDYRQLNKKSYYDIKTKTSKDFSFTYLNGINQNYFKICKLLTHLLFVDDDCFYIVPFETLKKWVAETKPDTYTSKRTKGARYFWISVEMIKSLSSAQIQRKTKLLITNII